MINEYGGIGGMRIATLSTIKPTWPGIESGRPPEVLGGLSLGYYPDISREWLRKNTTNINQDSRCPGRGSNRGRPKYKSEASPLERA
jgi:hypothetical protein